jgi:hypothetical protein
MFNDRADKGTTLSATSINLDDSTNFNNISTNFKGIPTNFKGIPTTDFKGLTQKWRLEDTSRENVSYENHNKRSRSENLPTSTINGFFSAQGDYAEFKPNDMSGTIIDGIANNDANKGKYKKYKPTENVSNDGLSIDTPSDDSISSDSSFESVPLDSFPFDSKDIDKHIKSKSKFNTKKRSKRHRCVDFDLDSVDSLESLDSGESLLRHIRFCKECKDKIMGLIKKHKSHNRKKTITNSEIKSNLKLNEKNNLVSTNEKCENIIQSVKQLMGSDYKNKNDQLIDGLRIDNFDDLTKNKEDEYINKYNEITKDSTSNKTANTDSLVKFPEIRDIITVCLIGFIVIVILDLLMKNK